MKKTLIDFMTSDYVTHKTATCIHEHNYQTHPRVIILNVFYCNTAALPCKH